MLANLLTATFVYPSREQRPVPFLLARPVKRGVAFRAHGSYTMRLPKGNEVRRDQLVHTRWIDPTPTADRMQSIPNGNESEGTIAS